MNERDNTLPDRTTTTTNTTPQEGWGAPRTRRRALIAGFLLALAAILLVVGILQGRLFSPQSTTDEHLYPFPGSGHFLAADSLRGVSAQWPEQTVGFGGKCTYQNDGYHITQGGLGAFSSCERENTDATNIALQVNMLIKSGDCGGVVVRQLINMGGEYVLFVCANGSFQFSRYDSSSNAVTLASASNSNIKQGIGTTNKIGIVASDSTFTFFANGKQIGTARDGNYIHGALGLLASARTGATEVVYTDASLWEVSG